jgi:hypothetical protein
MKRLLYYIAAVGAFCGICATQAFAQHSSSATQVVTFSVHRSTMPASLVSLSSSVPDGRRADEQILSLEHSPLPRSLPKFTVTLDSRQPKSLAVELGTANTVVEVKNELINYATREPVVLTVSD